MNDLTVCIVTWNSSKFIEKCLQHINKQTYKNFELLIIDNNSTDNTIEIVEKTSPYAKIVKSEENLGFCGGHNLGISISKTEFYMPYNPDIFAENNFFEEMVNCIKQYGEQVGSISGKLLRYDIEENTPTNIIDSTGIYFKKNRRSLDRGQEEQDKNQYNSIEYVFGASGAAPLYRRKMLEDIKINNQYFLEYFFAYREDVDLAWRAQHKNWSCLYCPTALAYHVRNNTPLKRDLMSKNVNMHSVKNRVLLLLQNETKYGVFKDGLIFIPYDICIFLFVLFKEKYSLQGFKFIIKNRKEIFKIRKEIIGTSRHDSKSLNEWFGRYSSKPL